jgi:phage terminase large subunit-like protein
MALGARSMVLSVAVAQNPAGNLKPAKDKSTERIDGIIALIMAIGRALVAPGERGGTARVSDIGLGRQVNR